MSALEQLAGLGTNFSIVATQKTGVNADTEVVQANAKRVYLLIAGGGTVSFSWRITGTLTAGAGYALGNNVNYLELYLERHKTVVQQAITLVPNGPGATINILEVFYNGGGC